MSLLSELVTIMDGASVPVETGAFSGVPPDEYVVLTPLTDDFTLFADNMPQLETQEVRISLFSKNNYRRRARRITSLILDAGITISERRYIGYDTETSYHGYSMDAVKLYDTIYLEDTEEE